MPSDRLRRFLVHKGNIMKLTEGDSTWIRVGEREYGDQVFTENVFNKIKAEQGLKEAVAAYNEAMESGKVIIRM